VDGVVAAVQTNNGCGLGSGCGLGYLAIKEASGNVIYLLHGLPLGAYSQVGTLVSIGAQIYTTGNNGSSNGPHLHFEVHNSVIGQLSTIPNPGPGDDINPESWLGASGCPGADPATATAGSTGGTNLSSYFNWYTHDAFLLSADNIHMLNLGGAPAIGSVNLPGVSGYGYYVGAGQEAYYNFPATTAGGPVQIAWAAGPTVLTSQRVIYESSHNEVNSLTNAGTTLYFPFYGKANCYWEDNIHLLNPSIGSASGTVSIPGYAPIAFTLGSGQEGYYGFPPGTVGGPVKVSVTSGPAVLGSQRVTFNRSQDEVNALNPSNAASILYLMYYGMTSDYTADWIHVVNPGLSTAIGTITVGSSTLNFTLSPGGEWHQQFGTGVYGAATIQVTSGPPVLASQRVEYRDSFSEVNALGSASASTSLHFNFYGYVPTAQISADFIHIVNPSRVPSSGWISIPGQPNQPFSVDAGGYYYYEFPAGTSGGPVTIQITSGAGVLASQRVQFYNSFHEVNALELG